MAFDRSKLEKHKEGKRKEVNLDQLIGASGSSDIDSLLNDHVEEVVEEAKAEGRFFTLPKHLIKPDPSQPRKDFNENALGELRSDIESIGQLQPVLVRPESGDGTYQLISGERRWRAISGSDSLDSIDVVVAVGSLSELLVLRMQVQENNIREQLSAIEQAEAIKRVVSLCKSEGGNQTQAAGLLGLSVGTLSKYMALTDANPLVVGLSLNGEIQDVETLYLLDKAYQVSPDKMERLVEDWRDGVLEKSLRAASKEITSSKSKKKKPTKNKPSGEREAKLKPATLDDLSIVFSESGALLSLSAGGVSYKYEVSQELENKLIDTFKNGRDDNV